MPDKYKAGMQGQQVAEAYLANKGYKILERNYRIRIGEVDLIAQYENYVVFIEVKTRSGVKYGYPREAVGAAKQQRIVQTAMHYISAKGLNSNDFRFDVIEVYTHNGEARVEHIENAFDVS